MTTNNNYLDFVLDLLKNCEDITFKRMMGEYLLYSNGILFGGIYDNRFLIKVTKSNISFNFKLELPYTGAKMMYLVDLEDCEKVFEIVSNVVKDIRNGKIK